MQRKMSWSALCCLVAVNTGNTASSWSFPQRVPRALDIVNLPSRVSPFSRFQTKALSSSDDSTETDGPSFRWGEKIQVEVVSFGPLGASVDVIGIGHAAEDLIPESSPPLGRGLILQREIRYFRDARDNVDVVVGEVLPAYVEGVRDDGKLHIAFRAPGGKAKALEVGQMILDRLEWSGDGTLFVGDKSSPEEIGQEFPGVSKSSFKKAVAALFKKGLVKPGPNSISLIKSKK